MSPDQRFPARARAAYLVIAGVLWAAFVLVAATGRLPTASGGLLLAGAWHAVTGLAVARAFPPREYAAGASEGAFALTRNVLLATVASLVSALAVAFLVRGA